MAVTTSTIPPNCGHKLCFAKGKPQIITELTNNYQNLTGEKCTGCGATGKAYLVHLQTLTNDELLILYEHELGKEFSYACLSPSPG